MNPTKNVICKDYLEHMTKAEKKAYNAEYYRKHKDYWREYYKKTGGVPVAIGRDTDGRKVNVPVEPSADWMHVNSNPDYRRELARQAAARGDIKEYNRQTAYANTEANYDKWYEAYGRGINPRNVNGYRSAQETASTANARRNTGKMVANGSMKKSMTSVFGSKLASAGKSFIKNWKSGAKSIKNLFS